LPVTDDASADARRRLDKEQVVLGRPVGALLAERHDVDVVVDEHRHVERAPHVTWHVEVVPAGHNRWVCGPPRRVFDRTGQADADAAQLGPAITEGVEQLVCAVDHEIEHRAWTGLDSDLRAKARKHCANESSDRDYTVRRPQVYGKHHARGRVEGES